MTGTLTNQPHPAESAGCNGSSDTTCLNTNPQVNIEDFIFFYQKFCIAIKNEKQTKIIKY